MRQLLDAHRQVERTFIKNISQNDSSQSDKENQIFIKLF